MGYSPSFTWRDKDEEKKGKDEKRKTPEKILFFLSQEKREKKHRIYT